MNFLNSSISKGKRLKLNFHDSDELRSSSFVYLLILCQYAIVHAELSLEYDVSARSNSVSTITKVRMFRMCDVKKLGRRFFI